MVRLTATILLTAALTAGAAGEPRHGIVVLLVGPPGAGKTEQAKRLAKRYQVPAVSVAELLQMELGRKTPLARAMAASIASGELLTDEAANQLVSARILRPDMRRGFILDGYPMSAAQARALDNFLEHHHLANPNVVVLEAPDETVRQRMLKRKRIDDKPENIERRIREYRGQWQLLEQWYGASRLLRVDGTQPIAAVTASIERAMEEALLRRGFSTRTAPTDRSRN